MLDVLIKNAQIVDGSGTPGHRGSVGIRDGRITLDTDNESASQTIDADGLVVAPGFVDLHTHYDPQVLWDGSASPSTLHGFTTVFGGNCGFSIAPLRADTADYHKRMMAVVEGMPVESLLSGPAWDWSSFGDWLGRIEDNLSINAGFLVGHSALRLAVMGKNAIGAQASESEIRDMQSLLATSLEAGGMGFSSTQKTVHVDHNGDFVPSYHATRDEMLALSEVLGRYPGTSLGYASNDIARYKYPAKDIELMTAMSSRAGRPINWNTIRILPDDMEFTEEQLKAYDYSAAHDGCIIGLVNPKPFKVWVGFKSGMAFSGLKRWNEVFGLPEEERKRALGDPQVRDQIRKEIASADLRLSQRTLVNWAGYEVAEGFSPQAQKLQGRNIGELARERNADPFDVLLDIMIEDDLRTEWAVREPDDSAEAWRKRAEIWLDPRTILGGSDAGAHINSMVGATYSTVLLGEQVRERQLLSLEEAVRQITDVPARFYGLQQRGRIAEGFHADLVVFDPKTVGAGPEKMRADMPGGGRRLYSEAFGIEHVFVNGGETVRANKATGAQTGRIMRSGRDTTGVTTKRTEARRPVPCVTAEEHSLETVLEPELPICDAHHHLWEWKPALPDKRYLPEDLAADIRASGHNVRSTVYIEVGEKYLATGPDVLRTVGEVEWVDSIAGRNGDIDIAAAIVGHVDLCRGSEIEAALDAMKAASPKRFRGIRHTVRHQNFPGIFNRVDRAGLLLEPGFRDGARVIARMGLTLEGCLYFLQIPELVDLLRNIPDLTFIANHFAGPLMVGPYAERADEVHEEWRRNVVALSKCPNAIMKLGGVGTHFPRDVGVDWKQRETPVGSEEVADVIAPWVHHCIEHFGPDRCLFESNFPGDKACVSYRVLYNAFKRVSARYSPKERADLFHDTAVRVYGVTQ